MWLAAGFVIKPTAVLLGILLLRGLREPQRATQPTLTGAFAPSANSSPPKAPASSAAGDEMAGAEDHRSLASGHVCKTICCPMVFYEKHSWHAEGSPRERLGTEADHMSTLDQSGEEAGFPLIPVWQWLLGWATP